MSAGFRFRRTTTSHRVPRLEPLETRSLLSADPAGIAGVSPADGSILSQSPQQLEISFDPSDVDAYDQYLASVFPFPIPTSEALSSVLSGEDVQILAVNRDGSTTPVFNFADYSLPEELDPTGTELIIPMQLLLNGTGPPINVTLPPGTYEMVLEPTSLATAISEAYSTESPPLWNDNVPLLLSTFSVLGTGATLGKAPTLPVGPTPQSYEFSLNPDDAQSAVDLYKITLTPGQLWQLGVSVSTQSIDSPLLTTLCLFDANGNLLAESNSGDGIPGDLNDPYLFAGLSPTAQSDTYYIGVSGYQNLPYGSNGYDPVLGIPGTAGMSQPGGPFPFELSIAAQPHVQATQLLSFSLDHADPDDPSPTSITLEFSGPIDVSSIFVPDRQEMGLEVVDSSGQMWPVTAMEYETNDASLTFVFDAPLPAGQYSLIVPSTGGLTDLAGVPVVAPDEPAGVLATWTVASATVAPDPNDLGVLWPSAGGVVWPAASAGLSGTTLLQPGQAATYQWVAIVPGIYSMETSVDGSEVEIENASTSATIVLTTDDTGRLSFNLTHVSDGIYELTLANVGSAPTLVKWVLAPGLLDWEKILDNGVSSTSALSLMTFGTGLVSAGLGPGPGLASGGGLSSSSGADVGLGTVPDSDSPFSSPAATGIDSSAGLLSVGLAAAGSPIGGSMGAVPASLFITSNIALAGLPGGTGEPLAPAGPPVEEAIGPAGGFTGQSASNGYGSLLALIRGPEDGGSSTIEPVEEESGSNGRTVGATAAAVAGSHTLDAATARADLHALAQSEWLDRLGLFARDWFGSAARDAPTRPAPGDPAAPRLMVGHQLARALDVPAGPERNRRIISMLRGELGVAASVIMMGAVAFRLRKPLNHWWRHRGQLAATGQTTVRSALPRPHSTAEASRVATRVRRVHS